MGGGLDWGLRLMFYDFQFIASPLLLSGLPRRDTEIQGIPFNPTWPTPPPPQRH